MPRKTPVDQLTSIVPKWLVIVLAVVAFVLANALLGSGLFLPEKFEHPTARFILCTAISMNLALFFFVLYPQVIKLTEIPVLHLTIHLVGPIALYIVVLLFLWKIMPEPPTVTYRFFIPYERGKRADHISRDLVTLTPAEETFVYHLVPNEDGLLAGVYVRFESGKEGYKARFAATFYKPVEVTFQRGPGEGSFEVERNPPP
jgi:hypothetical protein